MKTMTKLMKTVDRNRGSRRAMGVVLSAMCAAAGCATAPPAELVSARDAYSRASGGPAAQLVPADLHKAKVALDAAEASFADEHASQKTIDLAYIAERTTETAEAHGRTAVSEQQAAKLKQDFDEKQSQIAKQNHVALVQTRDQLAESQRGQAEEAQQVGVERAARAEADTKAAASEEKAAASEQKVTEANAALAKLAAKDEERGLVITLSGSVLFRSNDAALQPAAETRLDEVAAALVAKGHPVVVEGYTDSKGSQSKNIDLSQRRAETVRTYLVSRGVPSNSIEAKGMGPDRPVADNASTEGRANNRRVEIVIAKNPAGAN
jgi:outer membrane protein OmpA-like peptidoglycan-associated protein